MSGGTAYGHAGSHVRGEGPISGGLAYGRGSKWERGAHEWAPSIWTGATRGPRAGRICNGSLNLQVVTGKEREQRSSLAAPCICITLGYSLAHAPHVEVTTQLELAAWTRSIRAAASSAATASGSRGVAMQPGRTWGGVGGDCARGKLRVQPQAFSWQCPAGAEAGRGWEREQRDA
jgi:hypothetical protein